MQKRETELPVREMRVKLIITLSITLVIMGLISAFVIHLLGNGFPTWSFYLGALLGILNGIVGFLTIEKFIDRSTLAFLKGIFMGMGIRMFLLLGIFIVFMKFLGAHLVALVSGLMIFYFVMAVFEIIFLNKRLALKRKPKESTL